MYFTRSGRYRTEPRQKKERDMPPQASVIPAVIAAGSTINAVRPAPTISLSFTTPKPASAPRQPLPSAPVSKPVAAPPPPKLPLKLVLTAKPGVGVPNALPKQPVVPKPAITSESAVVTKPIIKLERSPQPLQTQGAMKPPKRPLEQNSADRPRPTKILKLSVKGAKLDAILSRTPQPSRPIAQTPSKKSKTASASPAPRPNIKLEQSPAPRISMSPGPAKQNSVQKPALSPAPAKQSTITAVPRTPSSHTALNGAAKPRQKLPDSSEAGTRQKLPDSAPLSRPTSISVPSASPVTAASSSSPTASEPKKSLKIKLKLGAGTKKFDTDGRTSTSQPPPPASSSAS